MGSFRILALLCILSGFSIEYANAQASSKLKYNLSIGNTNKYSINPDTSFSHKNIIETPNSVFISPIENYDEILKTSIDNGIRLTAESSSAASYGTFNGKWERLTGKSIIDTSKIYYSPLKRINNPTIYDNQLYRTGATIFNMLMIIKYPYVSRHN